MSWNLRERDEREDMRSAMRIKRMVKKLKDRIEDLCEEIDDMEEGDYGERDDYEERHARRARYRDDDDDFGERRGVRGTGRYSRLR
ncbi:MAG: hypothetical protein J1E33_06560 [Alistipes sp.]|nr:hypothetical protein [Alistipes sp.]